jgi:hypothetical protein
MKTLKMSKAGLLIIAAGAFIVVLAGLGMTQYGQASEQDRLKEELAFSTMRLNNLGLGPLQDQLEGLQSKLEVSQDQLQEAKNKLDRTVVSVDVTDEFNMIANANDVIIDNIGTAKIQVGAYANISCSMTTINAAVDGDLEHIISFITGLNNGFTTGFVSSVQIEIGDATIARGTVANIVMVVYSYEGN